MRTQPLKRSYGVRIVRGITLIEVVVSLVLLASLVSGMVVAYSAHHRQALHASQRQLAIAAADRLLAQWYATGEPTVPRSGFGEVDGQPGIVWQTQVIHQNLIETLPVEVVRLQLFSSSTFSKNATEAVGETRPTKPLAQVDVILPIAKNRL